MTYYVNDACIKSKYTDCVEVCPVDCFYEGENFLAINPDECIDCGVCEPECPAGAILPDTTKDVSPFVVNTWVNLNRELSEMWPVITKKKEPLEGADSVNPKLGYTGNKGQDLSKKPGPGD